VTSDARAIPREEDDAVASADPTPEATVGSRESPATGRVVDPDGAEVPSDERKPSRRDRRGDAGDGAVEATRPSLPLVPVLAVLLVLLLAGAGYLWFTRPAGSAVRTADYVDVLQAARSGVVDMTSFDHLTLDDDIEQIRRVATGDLREEAVAQLDGRRQQITDAQAVVNTEVVGAGVLRAAGDEATVMLVIQSTQKSTAEQQAQVVRYRIEVELQKSDGRWLLSGIKGTGTDE
jgi:hypothetical protein